MKLPCKVIEDMLPMYYDSVCSEETAQLVEAHLETCPACNNVLAQLRAEMDIPPIPVDDAKPLKEIQEKWKKSEWSWLKKGILITLAALLLVMAVSVGIWYFSYAKSYWKMTRTMAPTSEEAHFYTSSDYMAQQGDYQFEVWLPELLSSNGFARVTEENGLVLFLYPELGGGCTFKLLITDPDNQIWVVYLGEDGVPDFENHQFPVHSDSEKAHIRNLMTEKSAQIQAMLDAVSGRWGISLQKKEK
jgi:hypothetical protein